MGFWEVVVLKAVVFVALTVPVLVGALAEAENLELVALGSVPVFAPFPLASLFASAPSHTSSPWDPILAAEGSVGGTWEVEVVRP